MSDTFRYGLMQFQGAKPGDPVRYVPGAKVGIPGAIYRAKAPHEINAVLESVNHTMGYCRIKPQLNQASAGAESGGASGIRIPMPVKAGGRLKIG